MSVWLEIAPDLSFLHGAPSLCPPCARASPQVCVRAEMGLYKDATSGALCLSSLCIPGAPPACGRWGPGEGRLHAHLRGTSGLVTCKHILWGRISEGLAVGEWVLCLCSFVFRTLSKGRQLTCPLLVLLGTEGKKLGTCKLRIYCWWAEPTVNGVPLLNGFLIRVDELERKDIVVR